jgi:hypothetical protein
VRFCVLTAVTIKYYCLLGYDAVCFGRSLSVPPPSTPLKLAASITNFLPVFFLTSLHLLLDQPEPVLPPINLFFKDDPFKSHILHIFLLADLRSLRAPDPVFLLPTSLLHISRLSLLVYPEDLGSSFLRNVGRKLPDYMASHTRRQKQLCPKRWACLVVKTV